MDAERRGGSRYICSAVTWDAGRDGPTRISENAKTSHALAEGTPGGRAAHPEPDTAHTPHATRVPYASRGPWRARPGPRDADRGCPWRLACHIVPWTPISMSRLWRFDASATRRSTDRRVRAARRDARRESRLATPTGGGVPVSRRRFTRGNNMIYRKLRETGERYIDVTNTLHRKRNIIVQTMAYLARGHHIPSHD